MNGDLNLALFCDFENIALGARDAKYANFDIGLVLERLLLKGSIVAKKAYCDWDRYKKFKPGMHEAAFELIEIPHVKMSGKNSAGNRPAASAIAPNSGTSACNAARMVISSIPRRDRPRP